MTPQAASVNPVVAAQVEAVRRRFGLWCRDDHTFLRVTGPDAASWLHSQTSNHVLALDQGHGHANAILDRQGRLQAHFTLHRWDDEFWLIVEKTQAPTLLEQFEKHLFIEQVTIESTGDSLEQVVIQGPRALGFLASLLGPDEAVASELLPQTPWGCHPVELLGHEVLAFRLSPSGEDGYLFVAEQGEGKALLHELMERAAQWDACIVDTEAQEVLRIEAGIPKFGVDIDATHPIPETTLERTAVSYDKGCYLGQEVVARLRTYGSVKQALMGLLIGPFDGDWPPIGAALRIGGKKVGALMSHVLSPTLGAPVALAYLDRDRRVPGTEYAFEVEGRPTALNATAKVLPLYEAASREERAEALYHDALAIFERDLEDEDESAIPLLKEAILLCPAYEDAYEVLGVILHRHHRIEEAIHYMKILAKLNPDCVMAHTNLSVFYVAKGLIEDAEIEKAQAAVLQIRKISDEARAKEMADHERERIAREAGERIEMFIEVLSIDPEDPVATFGLGKAYMQLNRYEDAAPYFEKAADLQKDYSAAYLSLGKCHEFLGYIEEATEAYRNGIAVAGRKGDLMPMREMERRLHAIAAGRK